MDILIVSLSTFFFVIIFFGLGIFIAIMQDYIKEHGLPVIKWKSIWPAIKCIFKQHNIKPNQCCSHCGSKDDHD